MTTTAAPAPRVLWSCRVALVAVVSAVFGRIMAFGHLNWDDHTTIFENPALKPVSIVTFIDAWTSPHLSLWIPVTHTFWAVLALLAGGGDTLAVWPFRIASLALHATASVLVFEIVRRLLRNRLVPALLAAALFATHPINVEAVAWISGQKDLLAATLTFAAILCTTTSRDVDKKRHPLSVYAFAIAAMLAKPQAITVVAMLPLISVAAGDSWRRAIRAAFPLVPAAILVAIVARLAQPASLVEPTSLAWRPIVAIDALGFYLRQLVWPATLAIDYGRTPARVGIGFAMLAGLWLLVIAAIFDLPPRRGRRVDLAGLGVLVALAGVVPVLGIAPFEFQKYSTVADHYVYASMLGVALAVAGLVNVWPREGTILATAIVIACSVRSAVRVGDWRDTETVMTANLRAVPTSLAALRVLAFEASRRGDDRTASDLLERAVVAHRDGQAWFNLANARARLGDDPGARDAYEHAIALRPDLSPARYNFAVLLVRTGDLAEAERQLVAAQRLDPRAGLVADAIRKLRATSRPAR